MSAAALLGLAGCHKPDLLQAPKPVDELKQPPGDDPRFTGPPNYPAKLLNQDTMRANKDDDDGGPGHGQAPHMGAGTH